MMKSTRQCVLTVTIAMALVGAGLASTRDIKGEWTQMIVTVRPVHPGGSVPHDLQASDLTVMEGGSKIPVIHVERLAGDLADMQLFVLLDDSTRSSSLGVQLPELKTFLESLPATTQVAVGYMHNGTFGLAQAFTADHQKAASALRLPAAIPGENGSPYFGLSDLVRHWAAKEMGPAKETGTSKEPASRRAVLVLTDGIDRYYDTWIVDDPYVDTAIQDALKNGVTVSSIYLRGAGFHGGGGWVTTVAQSRLMEVSDETGGHAYFQDLTDPVTIAPFLRDFRERLENQYQVTLGALNGHGLRPVKLRTELPGLKIEGPTRVYVR